VDSQALSKPISPVFLLSKEPLSLCGITNSERCPSISDYNVHRPRAIPTPSERLA